MHGAYGLVKLQPNSLVGRRNLCKSLIASISRNEQRNSKTMMLLAIRKPMLMIERTSSDNHSRRDS